MSDTDDIEMLELASVPEALSLTAKLIRWGWGFIMARPEFVGCQQRMKDDKPGEAEWAISVRIVGGIPGLGLLESCTVKLIPEWYEKPEEYSSGPIRGFPNLDRSVGLRWQKEPGSAEQEEQTLYKGRVYYIPIAIWKSASGNKPSAAHFKTAKFFPTKENELQPGNYFFKIELKSGSKPPWRSNDYFQIGVPQNSENSMQFNLSVVTQEQFSERFGNRGSR